MDVSTGPASLRLNLGAGNKILAGYTSVDLAGYPDIVSDVRKLGVIEDETADEVMAIHLFEHIAFPDIPATLAEWKRVLKPGGLLVLELPDLIKCCQNVLANESDRLGIFGLYGEPLGPELMQHKWGWTTATLGTALRTAGFVKIKVAPVQFHKKRRDMRLEARKPFPAAWLESIAP